MRHPFTFFSRLSRLSPLRLLPLLGVFMGSSALAQIPMPPAYEIKTDTGYYRPIDSSRWQMLEDPKEKWTIEEVSKSPISNQFHFFSGKNSSPKNSIHSIWFRFVLKNMMNNEADISLPGNFEQVEFYIPGKNGKWQKFGSGWNMPWSKKGGLKFSGYIPLILQPNEEMAIYLRAHSSFLDSYSSGDYPIYILFTAKQVEYIEYQMGSYFVNGVHDSILFGLLLFAAIFNFFFFLIVREKVYLLFSVYLISLGIGRMSTEFFFVFLREFPWIHLYFMYVFWECALAFMALFVRSLLETRLHLPRWNKFFTTLIIVYLSYAVVDYILTFNPWFSPQLLDIGGYIAYLLRILLVLSILISFILTLREQQIKNRVLLIAITPAFFVWGICWSIDLAYEPFGFMRQSAIMIKYHEMWPIIETFCLSWLVLCFSWMLLQRFRLLQKQIAAQALEKEKEKTQLIEQQKIELERTVEERTTELNHSLQELKTTQKQLILSEKMASFGELTAGIAHEIQNPLNFVNNFSEVNNELIAEMKREMEDGNLPQAKIIAIDLAMNMGKITDHGKRAESIVRNMLHHARSNKGTTERTDINALVDEFLRLSYHGIRVKDNSFSANLERHFDPAVEKANVNPQDMGRVMINLYNNAFHAVSEKKRLQPSGYEPKVTVSTRRLPDKIEIKVMDNGIGIPEKTLDKIFQPFFTTKPTGQGTGLGLSLSYDIIKAHGGEIKVQSKVGEGSEFTVTLPI